MLDWMPSLKFAVPASVVEMISYFTLYLKLIGPVIEYQHGIRLCLHGKHHNVILGAKLWNQLSSKVAC
jgi:hypothetical protein